MMTFLLVCVALLGYNSAPQSGISRNWGAYLNSCLVPMNQDHSNKRPALREIKLTESDIKRFWSKVSTDPDENGCLLWQGGKFSSGYALFSINGTPFRANRVAYTIYHGPIPDGLIILHSCDNPQCVARNCLRTGTDLDNAKDKIARGRQCKGDNHPFRKDPSKVARGERHMSVTRPETLCRGDDHWTRKYPERLKRGSAHHNFGKTENVPHGETHHLAKLNEDKVREIRSRYAAGGVTQTQLAEEMDVQQTIISDVIRLKIWKHVI